eukprot:CAMPEP_0172313420 /NCGR_PEP_ID=MMETSP1058-20130122/20161_1 /TAXON_ID=83371 /ORGANISM="Detonula confervacea, Strain CCMP 353" /LENGTH=645 /DNA_ID=CAMNT_0013027065 /DNA_START=55 /DNA_END=1992 /DNA_ORIENTATION=+
MKMILMMAMLTAATAFTPPSHSNNPSSCRPHAIASSSSCRHASESNFESLGLSGDLIDVARRMNWEVPTPVQQLSIPAILDMAGTASGSDDRSSSLWCEGPTGSGKTGGFALPLLQILMDQNYYNQQQRKQQGHITTLILCPTRELAAQTGSVLQRLTSYLPNKQNNRSNNNNNEGISIDVIYGGVPMEPQVARLARKRKSGTDIDIVVATPGRLVDVLRHTENNHGDPKEAALERRILDALDEKSTGEGSLTLNEIQEMDLDREDDDGRATLDEMLHGLEYLVLDEADRLLGGAFKDDMDKLLSLFPSTTAAKEKKVGGTKLKTLLFSATFPEQIEERVDRVLSRMSVGVPLRVSTSASMVQRVMPLLDSDGEEFDIVGDKNEGTSSSSLDTQLSNRQKKHLASTTPIKNVLPDTAPRIQHRVIRLDERDRTQALRLLLEQHDEENGEWDRVLVFVATRYATEHISRKLRRYGISAAELHGKLDQAARERRLKAFRSGNTRVLISTDLAARGIDVEGLPVVVNFDLPRSAADFTHRTGRTGRAGKSGLAISFVSANSEAHFNFIERKELHGHQQEMIEQEVLPEFEPNEAKWEIESAASTMSVPGATHSQKGLAHDRMFGGVKSRRKSKKDKLREAAAKAARKK